MLHFVLERASEADPAAANLPRDLAGVVGAAGVDLKGVAAGIRELKAQLGRAREEVSAAERLAAQEQEDPGSTVDAELCAVTGLAVPTVAASHGAFVARVRGALGAVEGAVEEASAAEREAREALREASDFFGEGSSGEEMAVLVTVGVFLRHVERALGEMREKAKEEEGWSLR